MDYSCKNFEPHPDLLDTLFAFKRKVSTVFKEVLGIHELAHVSITRVTENNQLLTLSSTPALEFNLFNSSLWRYDHSYNPLWVKQLSSNYWQNLYHPARYDELYYVKQSKHAYPTGLSLAAHSHGSLVIYSFASHKSCQETQAIFATEQEDFARIGQYCMNRLIPFFNHHAEVADTTQRNSQ